MPKLIRYVGKLANPAGETLPFPADLESTQYPRMDVMLKVNAVSGSGSPSITVAVQELVDAAYFETGNSGALTTAGDKIMTFNNPGGAYEGYNHGFPAMGKGTKKRLVSTPSSLSGVDVDVWAVLWD